MKQEHCKTYQAEIFIAGCVIKAKDVCRDFVMEGACVSLYETDYIYTMGAEKGVTVRIINYPRFPRTPAEIKDIALRLANKLIVELYQGSCTIQLTDETIFLSRREGD